MQRDLYLLNINVSQKEVEVLNILSFSYLMFVGYLHLLRFTRRLIVGLKVKFLWVIFNTGKFQKITAIKGRNTNSFRGL